MPSTMDDLRRAGANAHRRRLIAEVERSICTTWYGRLAWRAGAWCARWGTRR